MRKPGMYAGLASLLILGGCEPAQSPQGNAQPLQSKVEQPVQKPDATPLPQERPYTSQFNYTTQIDPRDFGMKRHSPESGQIGDIIVYYECFSRTSHDLLVARLPPSDSDLEEVFDQLMTVNIRGTELDLKPGQGFRIAWEGRPVSINIDGMNGLDGGLQLWKYNDRSDLLKDNYLNKRALKLRVVSDGNYLYTFTLISNDIQDSYFDTAVKVYERFSQSFKRNK